MDDRDPLTTPPKGPRPGLRQEEPYASPQRPVPIRLNTNECPYPLPEGFVRDLQETIGRLSLNRYPDWEAVELRGLLAERTGWPIDATTFSTSFATLSLPVFSGCVRLLPSR